MNSSICRGFLTAIMLALSSAAMATGAGGEHNNTQCNGVGNHNSPCDNNSGGGQSNSDSSSNATGVGVGIGLGLASSEANVRNTNQNKNTNDNLNANFNSNSQGQGQTQGQGQEQQAVALGGSSVLKNTITTKTQSESVSEASNNGNNSNNSDNSSTNTASGNTTAVTVQGDSVVYKAAKIPVNTAYAPGLTSGIDTCLGSVSGGAQTSFLGVSLGGTKRDKNCEVIKNAHLIAEFNQQAGCQYVLANVKGAADAFKAAGVTCAPVVKEESKADNNVTRDELRKILSERDERLMKAALSK